jgi:hypothetical protein
MIRHAVCVICGARIVYRASRFVWIHANGIPIGYADHGPIPRRTT